MYFKNFPQVAYKFGDGEQPVAFTQLNAYVDLVDQIKDDVSAYQKYTILDGDRPDVLSYKLYNDVRFYWSFFFLNESLRESGWPLTQQEAYDVVKKNYPNQAIQTENNWFKGKFKVGALVSGNTSGATGKIIQTFPDIGMIIVDSPISFNTGEIVSTGTGADIETIVATKATTQYNAVHHYEDSNREWVDINPLDHNGHSYTPVTYLDRFLEFNNDLKEIKIFKPKVMLQVQTEFDKALRG